MKRLTKLQALQGVLVTTDHRGWIVLPFGRRNWRYWMTAYADGTIVLQPLEPKEE